ncbi:HD domain-containing protein [Kineococcus sp. SYSU DK006]|uniref:HD domain-containing protein n=1 Tax=Kineococcus sp. SYSU DK006 TaxID=3383127 RepID=UPI003D7E032B
MTGLAARAQQLAGSLLVDDPQRWAHTRAVAARAAEAAGSLPPAQRPVLLAAAWLHDIGYAPALRDTGFHPLDGARHLRAHGWPHAVVCLVAHHSGADHVARARGLAAQLAELRCAEPAPGSDAEALSDALAWADQTVGPRGEPLSLSERLADMLDRHGPDSPNARSHATREPYLRAAVARTEQRRRATLLSVVPAPAPGAPRPAGAGTRGG